MLILLLQACGQHARLADTSLCSQRLADLEAVAKQDRVWVSEPREVAGFPAFASNRFLASYDPQILREDQRQAWFTRLLSAGNQRRELLTLMVQAGPLDGAAENADLVSLESCAEQALVALPDGAATWDVLSAALHVPDDYSLWRRALGLYPLSSLAAKAAIADLQLELRETYAIPARELPVQGEMHYYVPPEKASKLDSDSTAPLQRDALGVVIPDAARLTTLFERHAPVWAVDTMGDFDRPGVPFYAGSGVPHVDSSEAVVFTYASMTRFQGAPQLQLNYLLWFDGRPKESVFDSLGGPLDGLLWRVTLNEQGQVLLYDSIHACGCYQLYFPSQVLALRDSASLLPEPPLVMRKAPALSAGERVVLHVGPVAHYLQGLSVLEKDAELEPEQSRYAFQDYVSLYRVRAPGGRRSLFDRNGIVRGTERSERFYLWPMGIRSPGAMRERGRHATAFVGRRHFDDADFIDQLFRRMN
ncbi:MAG: hypothetical protein AB8B57_00770 [Congregibacter sp.]